jgi:hypothetical protein
LKYVVPDARTSGRKPEAEKRPVDGNAKAEPAIKAGPQPAINAFEWNSGMAR